MANNCIVIDPKQPKRILAVIDKSFSAWWEQNLPAMTLIKNAEIFWGTLTDSNVGRFEYFYTKEGQFFLTDKPATMSLDAAYEYILK